MIRFNINILSDATTILVFILVLLFLVLFPMNASCNYADIDSAN